MGLNEAEEDVLCLLGMGEADELDAAQMLLVDDLAAAGLAEWRGETPALTAAGRAELDRMLVDRC